MTVPAVVNAGIGTTLSHGVAAVFTPVAQITNLDGPGSEMGTVETTNLSSLWKTYRKTLTDGGEVTASIELDPKSDSHLILTGLFFGNTQLAYGEPWQIAFTDVAATKCTFNAIITGFAVKGIAPESNLMADLKLKINGAPVWT